MFCIVVTMFALLQFMQFLLVFSSCFQTIQRFVIVDLSNFYFDVAKDRLYVG